MPERVARIATDVAALTKTKLARSSRWRPPRRCSPSMRRSRPPRPAPAAPASASWAREVEKVAETVKTLSLDLNEELAPLVTELTKLGDTLVEQVRGARLADLARNAIEIIDRNLYERSCDVRWWATDSAVVDVCANDTPEARTHANQRLGVILSPTPCTSTCGWPTARAG